ncbi:MAG: preprotein translocase subunit SecY [Candidatus Campbellbacteria bacterium]|nr:preprotein translocase subunit SecY [Candidatus Campbellbacteria bacterium]
MMKNFVQKFSIIMGDRQLRTRILFVIAGLALTRVFAAIPIPGVDINALSQFFANNQFFGLLNLFSGGGLSGLSIVMLGVGPYITGSIIMQLLTILSPQLKAMFHEEGEAGRRRIAQYSRLLTVPLAALSAFGFITLLQRNGVIGDLSSLSLITNIIVIVAGSVLLMWVGELISEFGIGNGMSLIIFAGIVSRIPSALQTTVFSFTPEQLPMYLAFLVVGLIIVIGVVIVTEAERPIPVTYAKQIRGNKVYGGVSTYLPLRVNQAGVMPIIFALSILLFPGMIANFLAGVANPIVQKMVAGVQWFLNNGWSYGVAYFLLVFLFTYFYTAVTFDPDAISKNLQRGGAFIPGVRPGQSTSEHIANILTRLTLLGASFLGVIAILPLIMQGLTGITSLAVGGTGLLIAVSVIIDLVKKIDAQVSLREY